MRLAVGQLELWRAKLAAQLGHEPSRSALGLSEGPELPEAIPAWFWELIDLGHPDVGPLERRLRELPRERVVLFQLLIQEAGYAVCDPSEGPDVGGGIGHLSDDGAEDFGRWVVAQGETLWRQSLDPEFDLQGLAREFVYEERRTRDYRSEDVVQALYADERDEEWDEFLDELLDLVDELSEDPSLLVAEPSPLAADGSS